jgi:hypothetical protein
MRNNINNSNNDWRKNVISSSLYSNRDRDAIFHGNYHK